MSASRLVFEAIWMSFYCQLMSLIAAASSSHLSALQLFVLEYNWLRVSVLHVLHSCSYNSLSLCYFYSFSLVFIFSLFLFSFLSVFFVFLFFFCICFVSLCFFFLFLVAFVFLFFFVCLFIFVSSFVCLSFRSYCLLSFKKKKFVLFL